MATGTIGAKIVLEGEAQYRKALRDIKTAQTELRSEMKLANTEFCKAQNSFDALTKKSQILSKQVETSAKKVDVFAQAVKNSALKEEEASKKVAELQTELDKASKEYEQMAKSSETTADAMEEQQKAIDKLQAELQLANDNYEKSVQSTKKYQTQLNYAKTELKNFENELEETNTKLSQADDSLDDNNKALDEYSNGLDEAGKKTNTFGDVLKANLTSTAIVEGLKMLVNGIKEIAEASIESGMAFESAMINVKALSGANATELERLSDKAKELGASTIYSASEVADAMSYMSLAGWNTEQTLQGISSVLNLASASSMDLARASDIVTDYLTAFGLKAEDSAKFTDQMAYAMSHSNTTVELLGESFKNCSATASSMGYSVKDVTSVLMTMANAGVKGGEAGTSLNSIMINLATNTKGSADALKKYGVEIYNERGEMNSLASILNGVADVWDTLSQKEQSALAKTVAGKTQYTGLMTIMNGLSDSAKETGMSFNDYAKALENCDGSAEKMAKTMQDNLKGQLTALDSALEGLKISAYEIFDDGLKKGVSEATKSVQTLNKAVQSGNLNTSLKKLGDNLGKLLVRVSDFAEKYLPKMIDGLSDFIDGSNGMVFAIKGIVTSLLAFKTATTVVSGLSTAMKSLEAMIMACTSAQAGMNAVANSNIYIALASAILGVTVAVGSFVKAGIDAMDIYERMDDESRDLIESSKDLREELDEQSKDREESRKSMDAQEKTALALATKLQKLQAEYKNGSDNMREQKKVIDELNAIYPELNLSINEQTGELNQSTQAILDNVDALSKQARYSAIQEDLEKISAKKYETDKKVYELESQLADLEQKRADAYALYQKNWNLHEKGYYVNFETPYYEAQTYAETIKEVSSELEKAKEKQTDLDAEYDLTVDYLENVTQSASETSESMKQLSESSQNGLGNVIELSEEASKSITDMYESVSKSVESQTDLFDEFNAKTSESKEVLLKNLESQITGLTDWADNLEKLAERGIDEGLYKKLAELGPEGANYVAEFVKMSDEELEKYGDKFAEAMKLEDSVSKKIAENYATVSEDILNGISKGLEDSSVATDSIKKVADETIEAYKEENGIHSPSKVYEELAKYITEGMVLGFEDGEKDVYAKIEDISNQSIEKANDILINSNNFESMGEMIDKGLIKGIEDGKSEVLKAMQNLCTETIKTAQTTLDIHSPSKKFEWLGEMSGEGYLNGLQSAMSDVSNTIGVAMNDVDTTTSVASNDNSSITQIAQMIAEYLPEIASNETNVNVQLEGDAGGLFNMIRNQNHQYIKSTGQSAFA